MNNYKSFSELKEELGNNYDFKLYEMGISALKEIENLQQENKQLEERINKALNKIRKMNDKDLMRFLNNVSQRNAQVCCKCGNVTFKENRIAIYTYKGCENKKLCTLCKDCYVSLLDYLEIADND